MGAKVTKVDNFCIILKLKINKNIMKTYIRVMNFKHIFYLYSILCFYESKVVVNVFISIKYYNKI